MFMDKHLSGLKLVRTNIVKSVVLVYKTLLSVSSGSHSKIFEPISDPILSFHDAGFLLSACVLSQSYEIVQPF